MTATAPWRVLHDDGRHLGWDRSLAPALRVAPGDALELGIRDAGDGQIGRESGSAAVASLDPQRANPLTGPVFVEGAEPGDALVVTVEGIALSGWGWTALIPGFGLLADQFPDPFLLLSTHTAERVALAPGIELPTRAFPGTVGVAPAEAGHHGAIPPRRVGGNLDTRDLAEGTRLVLPVAVSGALLSAGDTHAAQGRGEVCGTAVETPTTLRLRVDLRKGAGLRGPQLEIPPAARATRTSAVHATLGVGPDLREAARDAVSAMIDHLAAEHGLAPELAYCLCSTAADLTIEEIVNDPHWVVGLRLPLDVFV